MRRSSYEAGTEGLRGICALIVLYTHVFAPYCHVDPRYAPSAVFWTVEAGQGAVLLFFVLSGYVIGMTNQHPFGRAALVDYARRRALRLLPLYLLAVALSALVRPTDSASTVIGNLLFLQNDIGVGGFHVPLMQSNTNLWSLNYEMLYYGLFTFVWLAPSRWPWWLAGSAIAAMFAWRLPGGGLLVATYAAGWTFWLTGYALARVSKPDVNGAIDRLPWPSLMFAWLATWHLKPLWAFAHRLDLLPTGAAWMNFAFVDMIPASVALLMAASHRRPRYGWLLVWVSLLIPVLFVAWQFVRGREAPAPYAAMTAAALVCWFWRPSPRTFVWFAPVGMISYAVYIFQRPVQWFVLDRLPLPAGSPATFALRASVAVALTLAVSFFAERVLQPRIRSFLSRRERVSEGTSPAQAFRVSVEK